MDNAGIRFPLLPEKYQIDVLETLKIPEILSFSLCSKKTKNQVISLKLARAKIMVHVTRGMNIDFGSPRNWFAFLFYRDDDAEETDDFIQLPRPNTVHFSYGFRDNNEAGEQRWSKPEYEFEDWMEHAFSVFHHKKIELLLFTEGCSRFDVNSIFDALNGYPIVNLAIDRPHGTERIACQKAVEVFHNTNELTVMANPFEEPSSIRKVIIRNYHKLLMWYFDTFNDLLIINSSVIQLNFCRVSDRDLNRFLKLWIRGSNRKLEYLILNSSTVKEENSIFKDIRYTRNDVYRVFRPSVSISNYENKIFRGGYDIQRHDGTVATIVLSRGRMEMFVWYKY